MTGLLTIVSSGASWASEVSVDALLGFNGGTGGQLGFKVADPSPSLPWGVRVSMAYLRPTAGKTNDALRIFLGLEPTSLQNESDEVWSFRLDVSYRFKVQSFSELSVFGGVRHARFTAKYDSQHGERLMEVTSNPWGLGLGVEGNYELGTNTDLVIVGGLDYYFESSLTGDGVSFEPGGEDQNGYSYGDADKAVNQPSLEPLVMVGVSYRFGRQFRR